MFIAQDDFATDDFIELNKPYFDAYIKLRVHGYPKQEAFVRVFGADNWGGQQQGYNRTSAMEATQYFIEQFDAVLKATPTDELWNAKLAIHGYLETSRDPMNRDTVRLAAKKELSILTGIVVVDENGKTKAGRSLEDFYASVNE